MKSVLIIDDEEMVCKAFLLALEDTGYQVDTANSGEEGLKLYYQKKHDLIFLDLKMPGISGVEVLKNIRESGSSVPIYVVTAFHKEFLSELVEVGEKGMKFELLRKPIDNSQIVEVAQFVLEQ